MASHQGNIKVLPPKGKFFCEIVAGTLNAVEMKQVEETISAIPAG
jgi:hypothetical protein